MDARVKPAHDGNGISSCGRLGLLPPPLWGRAGEGGSSCFARCVRQLHTPYSDPHPQPLPTRGRGAHRVCCSTETPETNSSRQACSSLRRRAAPRLSSPGLTRRSIPPREKFLRRMMDARVKPAHDRGERRPARQTSRRARQHRGAELGVVVIGEGMQRAAGVAVIRGAMHHRQRARVSAASLRMLGAVDGPRLV